MAKFKEGQTVQFLNASNKLTEGKIASAPIPKGDQYGNYYVVQLSDGSGVEMREDKLTLKEIKEISFMNMKIFEKKEPVYDSLVLGVPIKIIVGVAAIVMIAKSKKR